MEQGNNLDKIAYRKLIAWQKADELAFQIYRATKNFPSEEKFGLVSQMRRATVSVAANIAEGYTRNSKKDKVHFYNIAVGSLTEIEYYLDFSFRLAYISNEQHQLLVKLREEVGRLLNGLAKGTKSKWQGIRDEEQGTRSKGQGTNTESRIKKQGTRMSLLFFLVSCSMFLVSASAAQAVTLYFSPSSGSHAVGTTFSVSVYVSSADQAMNAASGVISFPSDKLEVASLSKTGSIFSLWVQEPSFSNSAGTVNFEGIVLNPGFTGANGKAIAITFRAKAAGNAPLTFSSGSALANDGKGTNILASLETASFSLGIAEPVAPEAETPPAVVGTPAAPQVSSPTHPDPNKWYAVNDAKFTWSLSSGVTGVRLLVGRIANAVPTVTYIPAISSKELPDLADGIWYFSVRLKNNAGWGSVSHFRFQIDTQPPEPFTIKFIDGKETKNPKPTVVFDTTDSLSGVDYYKIKIGEGDFFTETPKIVENNPYTLPLQAPGKRNILVQAFDRAGNYAVATEEFVIKSLDAPIITEYPKELASGEILIIKGFAYPNSQVVIWLQKEKDEPQSQIVKADDGGNFTFVAEEKLKDGIYKLWAEVIDARGARSKPTEKTTIAVEQPAILKIGTRAVTIFAVIVPLVALIILLLALIWYGWHKFSSFRKKIRKETKEAEQALHRAFNALKEETEKRVAELDGKPDLSEREKKVCNSLKKALKISEKIIGKEIEDIEKEIKK